MPPLTLDSPGTHGFQRTTCSCELCKVYCRHLPGALDPSDLERLCPPGGDLFAWAEQHLRALLDKPYPTLVPARRENGSCHWYFAGRCAVHEVAPFCCAYFDSHMSESAAHQRRDATIAAIRQDVAAQGPYYRVWAHLRKAGLVGSTGDRNALRREMLRIQRRAGTASTGLK